MIYYGEILFLRMPILRLTGNNIDNAAELIAKLELKDYHYSISVDGNIDIPSNFKYLRLLNMPSPTHNPPLIHTSSLTLIKPYSNISNAKKLSLLYIIPINDGIDYLDMTETHGYLVLLVIGCDSSIIGKLLAKFVDAQYVIFDNKLIYNRNAELAELALQDLIDLFVNYRRGRQMKKAY